MDSITVKMAAFAPMPKARVSVAVAVNALCFRNWRPAKRRSPKKFLAVFSQPYAFARSLATLTLPASSRAADPVPGQAATRAR